MKTLLAFLSLAFFASTAWAADVIGNGAKSFICDNGKTALLLDLWEATELRRGIQIDEGLERASGVVLDEWEIAHAVISRIRSLDPARHDRYMLHLKDFRQEMLLVKKGILRTIDDSHEYAVPENCEEKQVAVQITPEKPEDPRYLIDNAIWSLMTPLTRAALVMHEIVYREALEEGHSDSDDVRYFNSILFSRQIRDYSRLKYANTVADSKLQYQIRVTAKSADFLIVTLKPKTYGDSRSERSWKERITASCAGHGLDAATFDQERTINGLYPDLGEQLEGLFGRNIAVNVSYLERVYADGPSVRTGPRGAVLTSGAVDHDFITPSTLFPHFAVCEGTKIFPIAPPIVSPVNGNTYVLLGQSDWVSAESVAQSMGGHLATVRSQAEQDWIFQTFGMYGGSPRNLWIGLFRSANKQFVWTSGEQVQFDNWGEIEPNNVDGIENYVEIFYAGHHEAGKWNDVPNVQTSWTVPIYGLVEIPKRR